MEDPEAFGELVGAIADYKIEIVKRAYDAARPEVFMFHDDWGTSVSTFFAPDTWRELFKPHVKRICDAILDRGMVCGLHSCGAISPLIGDVVDMGISFWEAQGECNDLDALRAQYPSLTILTTPPSEVVGGFLKAASWGPGTRLPAMPKSPRSCGTSGLARTRRQVVGGRRDLQDCRSCAAFRLAGPARRPRGRQDCRSCAAFRFAGLARRPRGWPGARHAVPAHAKKAPCGAFFVAWPFPSGPRTPPESRRPGSPRRDRRAANCRTGLCAAAT